MKKLTLASLFIMSIFATANAQIGTINISENLPESQSITGLSLIDPGFQNSIVMVKWSGATIFNQKGQFYLMDPKTFQEKKKADCPSYKGYEDFSIKCHPSIDIYPFYNGSQFVLNQSIINLYSKRSGKDYGIFAAKVGENLEAPKQPEHLFTTNDRESAHFLSNENKDLCIFSFRNENKKTNQITFNYQVYDQHLKLLLSDSVSGNYKEPDTLYTSIFDKGFAIIKNMGPKINVKIQDISTQKTFDLDLSYNNNQMVLEKIQPLKDNTFVLFGRYFKVLKNKDTKGGFFKFIYNPAIGKITDQAYFDHVAAGKAERPEKFKFVEQAIITETGDCYALISQFLRTSSGKMTVEYTEKFEMIYIHNDTEKWRRQFPIYCKINDLTMFRANDHIYLAFPYAFGPSVKIDYNKYIYGEQKISFGQVPQLVMLKIDSKGYIENQMFKDINYRNVMFYNNGLIGLLEGSNAMIQSKRKLFTVTLN